MSPLTQPSRLFLRKTWAPMDPDAAAYIAAVEQADGQSLEETTKIAIDNFVLGCKADGIWDAIKASCILAGARTLQGALVPLVGPAPTNFNFVSGDYNRKTGLVGNGSTKYLDSNRSNTAETQDNQHLSTYVSTANTVSRAPYMGINGTNSPSTTNSFIYAINGFNSIFSLRFSIRNGTDTGNFGIDNAHSSTGFIGCSRNVSTTINARVNSTSYSNNTITSGTRATGNILIFSMNNIFFPNNPTNARLAFYSIGESLDLARLDARVSDLITAIGRAF